MIDDEKTKETSSDSPSSEASTDVVEQETAPVETSDEAEEKTAATGSEQEVSAGAEDEDGEVEFTSNDAEPFTDDPMGEAYDLECGSVLEDSPESTNLPWQTDVSSPKEFFSAEILYRYDILEEGEQKALNGSYRIELKGKDGGVWTVHLGDELNVVNAKEDADIVISMRQKDFLNLINGHLNPQLAILAKKMDVGGNVRRALAFQHILTPSPE